MHSLGYDIGSSSIKAAVIDVETGKTISTASYPREELEIQSPRPGWAEQDPERWWLCVQQVTKELISTGKISPDAIGSIGISYQMHGLVIVNSEHAVIRPAIIWCDSRAVQIGERAFQALGRETCLSTLLNSPGNFTASKLRWVKEHEPENFHSIAKALLPGDYIALRMTGEATTTVTGLSEGIFWNFQRNGISNELLGLYDIDQQLLPPIVPAIGIQGRLSRSAAAFLGLKEGTPVAYRAGDQPNNAFSLNVLEPGEIAATAGTSGVVYGITQTISSDPRSRVNLFAHVNHTTALPRMGVLLCINGTGILYSWIRRIMGGSVSYNQLNALAGQAPIGSDGLTILPFGNGAERMLENRVLGARIDGLDLVRHSTGQVVRAAQEGIAFAFQYGMQIMQSMGLATQVIRAGNANLFLSPVFRQTLANVSGAQIELYDTNGAVGAARGAAVGVGAYATMRDAFQTLKKIEVIQPCESETAPTQDTYDRWQGSLAQALPLSPFPRTIK
jgi:xylulokinase